MTEIERIKYNNNGETPVGEYMYVIVENISNPEDALGIFKQSMLAILENKHIPWNSQKWQKLLPKQIISFTNQLEEDDYKDELLTEIPIIVHKIIEIKDWEWYSFQLYDEGFEVVIKGDDIGGFALQLLHHQGILHINLATGDDTTIYHVKRAGLDVLTYKEWNPDTLELK